MEISDPPSSEDATPASGGSHTPASSSQASSSKNGAAASGGIPASTNQHGAAPARKATKASGGTETSVPTTHSADKSTKRSGGAQSSFNKRPPPVPPKGASTNTGGLSDIIQDLPDRVIHASGGANSGVSRSMLLAGRDGSQRDVNAAITYNSTDQTAWEKLGPHKFADVNDGDLAEWFIGHSIPLLFKKRFWNEPKINMLGICHNTIIHETGVIPPEVMIYAEQPLKRGSAFAKIIETEILISQDPSADPRKAISRNCLREAIKDTYPGAMNMTLQEIKDASSIYSGQVSNITKYLQQLPDNDDEGDEQEDQDQPTAEDPSDDTAAEPGPSTRGKSKSKPKPKTPAQEKDTAKAGTSKASANKQDKPKASTKDNEKAPRGPPHPPEKKPAVVKPWTMYAFSAVRDLVTSTQEFFGMQTTATKLREAEHAAERFRMRNDTEGASFAAFYATTIVCAMADSLGYSAAFIPPEPKNQRQARARPDAERWLKAEEKELTTLWKMGTFELVDIDPTKKYDPLPLQFVYKLKVKDGDFENCVPKARLVIMGHLQYEEEYGDTYAPTARLWVVRTLAAIAAQEGLVMKKFDLTGAFLVADINKELYVQIPGYEPPRGKIVKLKKALYGGKSSGALYAQEIRGWLEEYGFKTCSVDQTLFRLTREKNGKTSTLLISLYVDDGACCTNDEELYQEFLTALRSKYELSDSGDLDWHLGMKINQRHDEGVISLDQTAYIDAVLKRFNMQDATAKPTPLPPHTHLTKADCPAVPDRERVKVYQQLIGSLMYIACGTRPDIAYAVNSCSQFMTNPGESHLQAAKHILRYLKGSREEKLTYRRQTPEMANVLYGYVDADHAGCTDDRKSVGGYVLMLNGGAISWSSRKIKVVSLSSFESEWYSASICGCEIVVVRRLLEEIGRPQAQPTQLFEDNAACIYSAMNYKTPLNQRSKHIDTRVFKLREFVEEGVLVLSKVSSFANVADCLTKSLPREVVERSRRYMFGDGSVD